LLVLTDGTDCKLTSFSESNMERDKFMNPLEAKEFGLIDMVLEHPPKYHDNHNESNLTGERQRGIGQL